MTYTNYDPSAKSDGITDNIAVEYPALPEGYRWKVHKGAKYDDYYGRWDDWIMRIAIEKRARTKGFLFKREVWETLFDREVFRLETGRRGQIQDSYSHPIPTEEQLRKKITLSIAVLKDKLDTHLEFEGKLGNLLSAAEKMAA